jgi:hypothetical protein
METESRALPSKSVADFAAEAGLGARLCASLHHSYSLLAPIFIDRERTLQDHSQPSKTPEAGASVNYAGLLFIRLHRG